MKSVKGQIYVAVVCAVLGLMLAYQFKAVKHFTIITTNKGTEDLSKQIEMLQKQRDDLEQANQDLEKQRNELEQNAANTSDTANSLKNQLTSIRMFAGLEDVQGPGVKITVTPKVSNLAGSELPVQIVSSDLEAIINELNAAGAEAISINNQRIINITPIRSVSDDDFITINGTFRFSAYEPFTISAIGDSDELEKAISMTGGIKDYLQAGLDIKIQKLKNLKIYKYGKVPEMPHCTLVKDGE